MDPSALEIFYVERSFVERSFVERSFVRAQHSCWVAISGTPHIASDPPVYSPSAFDQAPIQFWDFPPLGLQAQSSSGL
jgi:hypothetical protein